MEMWKKQFTTHLIQSPVLGAISPKELSGGVKELILIYKDKSQIFNIVWMKFME
jgi:hypothetical protein